MKMVFVLLALLALAGSGCDGYACFDAIFPAVVVHVFDADTGEPIAKEALAIVREGTYVDTLTIHGADSQGRITTLAGAWGRAGLYSLTVTRPGYVMWERDNIRVRRDPCSVRTVVLTAELQPVE